MTEGKPKFDQINRGKPSSITGMKFVMKIQNQINFNLQGRNKKKYFTEKKPEMTYITGIKHC